MCLSATLRSEVNVRVKGGASSSRSTPDPRAVRPVHDTAYLSVRYRSGPSRDANESISC